MPAPLHQHQHVTSSPYFFCSQFRFHFTFSSISACRALLAVPNPPSPTLSERERQIRERKLLRQSHMITLGWGWRGGDDALQYSFVCPSPAHRLPVGIRPSKGTEGPSPSLQWRRCSQEHNGNGLAQRLAAAAAASQPKGSGLDFPPFSQAQTALSKTSAEWS